MNQPEVDIELATPIPGIVIEDGGVFF